MKLRQAIFVTYVIFGLACSSSSPTEPIPLSALNGQWTPSSPEVPGLSYQFTLALVDTRVTGAGLWSIPGRQPGTIAITGSTTADGVSLDLTLGYDSPGVLPFLIEHFEGTLKSATTLSGLLTFAAGSDQHTYRRVSP
jgi:hypothetical protein